MHDKILSKEKSNYLKAIAVILMVLLHLFAFPDRTKEMISIMRRNEIPLEYYIGSFGQICVPIFLFLSGYGMYITYNNTPKYKAIIKRIRNFYINYWIIFILFIPIGIVMNKIEPNIKDILLNLTGISNSFNAEWWFIKAYIILIIAYPIIYRYIYIYNIKFIMGISLIISLLGTLFTKIMYVKGIGIEFEYLTIIMNAQAYFIMGIIICKESIFDKVKEYINMKYSSKIIYYIILISISIFSMVFPIQSVSNYIVTPVFIFAIANIVNKSGTLAFISKHSTNIWLTHTFFCYYYFQELTFAPKYTILIFIWLMTLCILTSYLINFMHKGLIRLIEVRNKNMKLKLT